jgi:hypothetical protein
MTNLQSRSYLTVKTKTISHKIKKEIRVPTIPTPIQHSTGIPSQSNQKQEKTKGI